MKGHSHKFLSQGWQGIFYAAVLSASLVLARGVHSALSPSGLSDVFLYSALWSFLWAAVFVPVGRGLRRLIGAAVLVSGVLAMVSYGEALSPAIRLLVGSVGLLYLIKVALLLRHSIDEVRSIPKAGLLLFMTVWPGMDLRPFAARQHALPISARFFVAGYVRTIIGIGTILVLAIISPYLSRHAVGWAGIAALFIAVHFGYAQVLTTAMRLMGWDVKPIFDAPLRSTSLSEFWSRRWNRPFVEMNRALFLPPLKKAIGPLMAIWIVFAISGVLHEIGISYPAWSFWGLPLLYFMVQGTAVFSERKLPFLQRKRSLLPRIWTWSVILLPLPLLFHEGFRSVLIEPFISFVHRSLVRFTVRDYMSVGLWLAAAGHLLVLVASFQVPGKLKWHAELRRLSPFNRKIMWTYGGYIVGLIVSFALLTGFLHGELLRGEKGALCVALLIAVFWGARIVVDFFYFKHTDWPPGPEFIIGHTLLTSLFLFLTLVYGTLIVWHVALV